MKLSKRKNEQFPDGVHLIAEDPEDMVGQLSTWTHYLTFFTRSRIS
jgi:hypothetical protein